MKSAAAPLRQINLLNQPSQHRQRYYSNHEHQQHFYKNNKSSIFTHTRSQYQQNLVQHHSHNQALQAKHHHDHTGQQSLRLLQLHKKPKTIPSSTKSHYQHHQSSAKRFFVAPLLQKKKSSASSSSSLSSSLIRATGNPNVNSKSKSSTITGKTPTPAKINELLLESQKRSSSNIRGAKKNNPNRENSGQTMNKSNKRDTNHRHRLSSFSHYFFDRDKNNFQTQQHHQQQQKLFKNITQNKRHLVESQHRQRQRQKYLQRQNQQQQANQVSFSNNNNNYVDEKMVNTNDTMRMASTNDTTRMVNPNDTMNHQQYSIHRQQLSCEGSRSCQGIDDRNDDKDQDQEEKEKQRIKSAIQQRIVKQIFKELDKFKRTRAVEAQQISEIAGINIQTVMEKLRKNFHQEMLKCAINALEKAILISLSHEKEFHYNKVATKTDTWAKTDNYNTARSGNSLKKALATAIGTTCTMGTVGTLAILDQQVLSAQRRSNPNQKQQLGSTIEHNSSSFSQRTIQTPSGFEFSQAGQQSSRTTNRQGCNNHDESNQFQAIITDFAVKQDQSQQKINTSSPILSSNERIRQHKNRRVKARQEVSEFDISNGEREENNQIKNNKVGEDQNTKTSANGKGQQKQNRNSGMPHHQQHKQKKFSQLPPTSKRIKDRIMNNSKKFS